MDSPDVIMEDNPIMIARANMLWSTLLAFNGSTTAGMGKVIVSVNMREHSLSAINDIPHGAVLFIVLTAWMSWALDTKAVRLAEFARGIYNVKRRGSEVLAEKGVACLKLWFETIGSPVSLKAAGIPEKDIEKIAENAFVLSPSLVYKGYTKDVIVKILKHAC